MIFSLKGDAHKIYLQIKKKVETGQSIRESKGFREVEEIRELYQLLDNNTLKLIHYRVIKEKNGSGIIPILVSTIPWLLFLFSKPLTELLFRDGSILWAVFGAVYLLILTTSVIFHFREKAWAACHIQIIQDIIHKRLNESTS